MVRISSVFIGIALLSCFCAGTSGAVSFNHRDDGSMERPIRFLTTEEATKQEYVNAGKRRRNVIDGLFSRIRTRKQEKAKEPAPPAPPVSPAPQAAPVEPSSPVSTPSPAARSADNPPSSELSQQPAPSAVRSVTHTVRPGETLSTIARRFGGPEASWEVLARANGIEDPSRVPVGRQLVIPADLIAGVPGVGPREGTDGEIRRAPTVVHAHREPVFDRNRAPSQRPLDYANFEWRIYHIESGDTLENIASRFLGSPSQAELLARYNEMADDDPLVVGSGLLVPQPQRPERRERYLLSKQGIFR